MGHQSVINVQEAPAIIKMRRYIRKQQRKLIIAGVRHRTLLLEREVDGECRDFEIERVRKRIYFMHRRISKARARLVQSGAVTNLPCECYEPGMLVKVRLTIPNRESQVVIFTVINKKSDFCDKGYISHKVMIARCLCGAVIGREFEYPIRKGCADVGLFEILELHRQVKQAA